MRAMVEKGYSKPYSAALVLASSVIGAIHSRQVFR